MAVLLKMGNGKHEGYKNYNAVSKVLKYVLRIRKNEDRQNELLAFGGRGVITCYGGEEIINEFLYVQDIYRIDARKGRRMHHEVVSLNEAEFSKLGNDLRVLQAITEEFCDVYYSQGFQVVYAIHWDREKRLHIHFAINAVNYINGKKFHTSMNETKLREHYFNRIMEKYQNTCMGGVQCI